MVKLSLEAVVVLGLIFPSAFVVLLNATYYSPALRVPLSGSFPSAFRQSPYGTNYWGGRPYCPAQSNQNYYRRVIIRPHPHREHDKNSSIHVAPPPPLLPYVVSPHSYLPPIHFGVPFIVPGSSSTLSPTHMPLPTRPPALTVLVVKQIDHYFSEENLETDHHLKSLMDDQGWVHVHHIVNFRRVSNLTKNITLILKSLIARSNVVEVKDKSIRRKNGWEKWIRKSDDRVSNNN
ncbi:la-related protein 1B-like [Impatiens glandulifera]|uniref:la-related protein 1B-like n=1 Tax=Impatiens glandulifera TaxID=253017 RepID=UPI001FB0B8E9|nr:la-related protein 1B-like [Impatiens glandulifera]